MTARDPNGATWFTLRYREDVEPWPGDDRRLGPLLGRELAYDAGAGVLELLPDSPAREQRPLRGLAVQPDGDEYRVDADRRVVVVRCDGSSVPLVCGHRWCDPLGMALDRRGFLYVCDRGARQVLVVSPEDGALRARLEADDLREPVDVAVSAEGTVYVADRGAGDPIGTREGAVHVFDARFVRRARWVPRNDAGRPEVLRPIAVWVEPDGAVVVADARHPRLLRLDPAGGAVVAEPELRDLARPVLARTGAIRRLEDLYGPARLSRIVGSCCGGSAGDAGARLAAVHRALRLIQLRLSRRFEVRGRWTSRVLDSGRPGTQWHRVDLDAEMPPGTTLAVETISSERRETLADADFEALPSALDEEVAEPADPADEGREDADEAPAWRCLRDRDGRVVRFASRETAPADRGAIGYDARRAAALVREMLVPSPPGRYLRVRVRFESDGTDTPRLCALHVRFPRNGYLDLLPAIYRQDPAGADFLSRYLALFESRLTRIEAVAERFVRELDPAVVSAELVDWLASLVDLAFDPSWDLARRRALLGEAIELWKTRGTPGGIARYVEIYTGVRPLVVEAFLERPEHPVEGAGVLGAGLVVGGAPPATVPPDEALIAAHAHRFAVVLPIADPCDVSRLVAVVERIVSANKPAHTIHTLRTVAAGGRLDLESTVGVDLVLGGTEPAGTRLSDPARGGAGSVLGRDAVLGGIRPVERPPDEVL